MLPLTVKFDAWTGTDSAAAGATMDDVDAAVSPLTLGSPKGLTVSRLNENGKNGLKTLGLPSWAFSDVDDPD